MTKKPIHEFESFLIVEDYYNKNGKDLDLAFDQCENDIEGAKAAFREEMKELKKKVEKIISVEFTEFDSPRLHANGYFTIRYRGDEVTEEELYG